VLARADIYLYYLKKRNAFRDQTVHRSFVKRFRGLLHAPKRAKPNIEQSRQNGTGIQRPKPSLETIAPNVDILIFSFSPDLAPSAWCERDGR
jgi:hypothetical protein